MARRYMGTDHGDLFAELTATPDDVVVRLAPERWLTFDFRKVFGSRFDNARPHIR